MNARPTTILTNLQRGNVKQENPVLSHQRTIHELAAQGELYNIEPSIINIADSNSMSPLQWAAGYGQNATVELLLRAGADPNYKATGGRTALMFAASKGFFHVVKTLISENVNINDVDLVGNSAVMYAAHQDQALVVQELLRNGADLGIVNIYGQTAYSIASFYRNKSTQAIIEAHLLTLLKS